MWFGTTLVSIPVSFRDGTGQTAVIENWPPFGDRPPLHINHSLDEVFVVLKGLLRVVLDFRPMILNAGDRALAPKGVAHTYRVESADGAKFLAITTGGDFEAMVRRASRPATQAGLPAAMAPRPR